MTQTTTSSIKSYSTTAFLGCRLIDRVSVEKWGLRNNGDIRGRYLFHLRPLSRYLLSRPLSWYLFHSLFGLFDVSVLRALTGYCYQFGRGVHLLTEFISWQVKLRCHLYPY